MVQINSFPHRDIPLKTFWEKEKLLKMSNLSFFPKCSHLFQKILLTFIPTCISFLHLLSNLKRRKLAVDQGKG